MIFYLWAIHRHAIPAICQYVLYTLSFAYIVRVRRKIKNTNETRWIEWKLNEAMAKQLLCAVFFFKNKEKNGVFSSTLCFHIEIVIAIEIIGKITDRHLLAYKNPMNEWEYQTFHRTDAGGNNVYFPFVFAPFVLAICNQCYICIVWKFICTFIQSIIMMNQCIAFGLTSDDERTNASFVNESNHRIGKRNNEMYWHKYKLKRGQGEINLCVCPVYLMTIMIMMKTV